jgi:hypothetical protein
MPYTHTPWVRNGQVTGPGATAVIAVDSPQWFAWLDQVAAFGYSCATCPLRLTVRREKRRGQFYWYAYTKYQAKLHNTYLGKSQQLTQHRLEQVCQRLWQKATRKEGDREGRQ